MATISYNNETSNMTNLVTFTDVPNILKVTDTPDGTKANVSFTFSGTLGRVALPDEGYWYITYLGESITSVNLFANAVNKNFYASSANSQSTAASVARAFRNCPTIAANFTVKHSGNTVSMEARNIGAIGFSATTNISSSYLTIVTTAQGSAASPLHGSKVDVDVYQDNTYITTLEKNYYGSEVAFDLSPMLATLAKVGETQPYNLKLSYITLDGNYNELGSIGTNYVSQGFMCNQGQKFLRLTNSPIIAMNYSRGNPKTTSNNTSLYVYGNTIPISYYMPTNGTMAIDIVYRNSAFEELHSDDYNPSFGGSSKLKNDTIQLSQQWLSGASYVDIEVEATNEVLRFNVIKPMKATEYYQRIVWRNSYGGQSFFDFTGQRSESRSLDTKTYQKNIYDYYTSEVTEMDKVYDNDVEYTVTLKSHVIDADGTYLFNDLMQSPHVWTIINAVKYAILIDSVSIEETDRNNIFEVTVKYKYSMKPSII